MRAKKKTEFLTIGRLAKRARVSVYTILYYAKCGLLVPVKRTESGYRLYTPDSVTAMHFIKNAQKLGFPLKQIAKLLKLRLRRRDRCLKFQQYTGALLADFRQDIESLQRSAALVHGSSG